MRAICKTISTRFAQLALGAAFLVAAGSADAYTLYTDREAWLAAAAEYSIHPETFNRIPNGVYDIGTIPSPLLSNVWLTPSELTPIEIRNQQVIRHIPQSFGLQLQFTKWVYAMGADIVNPNDWFFQYGICEGPQFGGRMCFTGNSTSMEFIGWVADEGDRPLRQTYLFFDSARDEQFGWDNLAVGYATTYVYGGIAFPAGPVSFADKVVEYDPAFGGGPEPDVTQQDAQQILGVPEHGEMSLGNGGQVVVRFLDNKLVGSGDSRPDLYIFEVGGPETTTVEIRKNTGSWYPVGMATGYAAAIDIDAYGFGPGDWFTYVRLTDDGDSASEELTPGADLVAVGARSTMRWYSEEPYLTYWIQAHVGGRSMLTIRNYLIQWTHFKGTAPGQIRTTFGSGDPSNAPTIIDSNQGPNIEWTHNNWPPALSNGTHPYWTAHLRKLTPVFPQKEWCWNLVKRHGAGDVKIEEQPGPRNDYALKILINDLGKGNREHLSGSGFYAIELKTTGKGC